MARSNPSGVRYDGEGYQICAQCSKRVVQSGGRGRIKRYCSNCCKMRARAERVRRLRWRVYIFKRGLGRTHTHLVP